MAAIATGVATKGKLQYAAVVMSSHQSNFARSGTQMAFQSPEGSFETQYKNYVYRVHIRDLKGNPDPTTLQDASINFMTEARLDLTALSSLSALGDSNNNYNLTSRMVLIEFDNARLFTGARIVSVGTYVDIPMFEDLLKNKLVGSRQPGSEGGAGPQDSAPPTGTVTGDPGNLYWSNRQKQYQAIYLKQHTVYNGDLANSAGIDFKVVGGATLLPVVAEAFILLRAAYKTKFNKELTGTGYRDYAGQVKQKMRRAKGDFYSSAHRTDKITTQTTLKAQDPTGLAAVDAALLKASTNQKEVLRSGEYLGTTSNSGKGERAADGKWIGLAATPGRSDHGWGGAIDLNTGDWSPPGSKSSAEYKWLRENAKTHGFGIGNQPGGVSGEAWHLGYVKLWGDKSADKKGRPTKMVAGGVLTQRTVRPATGTV
jgi:LAS superfamily LD-carboxypeptidase LdcB